MCQQLTIMVKIKCMWVQLRDLEFHGSNCNKISIKYTRLDNLNLILIYWSIYHNVVALIIILILERK